MLGHAAAWARVVREAYGLDPCYLAARDGSGMLAGILPLVRFRSLGGQRALVSMPFLDTGGILARSDDAATALLARALHLTREAGARALELRQSEPLRTLPTPNPATPVVRSNLVLPLEPGDVTVAMVQTLMRRDLSSWRGRFGLVILDEATQAELEALGSPEVLVVPNGWHRLDCAVYKERYPELRVTCPAAARKAVERVVAVDEEAETGAVGGGVSCLEPAGTRPMERAWRLELDEGHALIFCDLLFNLDHLPGFGGWMARYVTASTGFFGVTRLGRFMGISDKAAFRGWLEDQADEDGLRIISVAHGEVLTEDCAVRLREAAGRL